ncbi:MAG: hypothetical protein HFF23_11105 [Oscillospiraceae bacterium]|jgi:hypothetical protein|nr:hypothetical protein [Oscillospiraceae bacterium]MCI9290015.1 hypothetical protein [Oscillospiraceae bacterium]
MLLGNAPPECPGFLDKTEAKKKYDMLIFNEICGIILMKLSGRRRKGAFYGKKRYGAVILVGPLVLAPGGGGECCR